MSFRELNPEMKVERSNILSKLLTDLSESNDLFDEDGEVKDRDKVEKFLADVKSIYKDEYRQRYSDLWQMLDNLQGPNEDNRKDLLTSNLERLVEQLRINPEDERYYLALNKLTDHIVLEIQRSRDYHRLIAGYTEVRDEANSKLEELRKQLDDAHMEIKEAHEEAQRSKMETVAILSIFSAIVIAFAGGLDFFGGTISAAGNNIFDVAFAILLCGLMFFNIIAFLMYMVLAVIRLHDPPRNDEEGGFYKRITSCTGGTFAFWLDVVLIVAMAITMILGFYFGN